MPTQRPPSLTTGTPGNSCSLSTAITCSSESSGRTVTGSRSMMSPTVAIRSPNLAIEGGGQRGDHVAGHHAVRSVGRRGEPPRADLRARDLQQAPELAGVRREDRRRAPLAHVFEPPGQRVQAVRVEDERDGDAPDEVARECLRVLALA